MAEPQPAERLAAALHLFVDKSEDGTTGYVRRHVPYLGFGTVSVREFLDALNAGIADGTLKHTAHRETDFVIPLDLIKWLEPRYVLHSMIKSLMKTYTLAVEIGLAGGDGTVNAEAQPAPQPDATRKTAGEPQAPPQPDPAPPVLTLLQERLLKVLSVLSGKTTAKHLTNGLSAKFPDEYEKLDNRTVEKAIAGLKRVHLIGLKRGKGYFLTDAGTTRLATIK